jgi:hypothetical protein
MLVTSLASLLTFLLAPAFNEAAFLHPPLNVTDLNPYSTPTVNAFWATAAASGQASAVTSLTPRVAFRNPTPAQSPIKILADSNQPLMFSTDILPVAITIRLTESDAEPLQVKSTFTPAIQRNTDGSKYLPHRWSFQSGFLYLEEYGDYYFVTNKGAFKILLLSSGNDSFTNILSLFDFYCRNTQIGHRDEGLAPAKLTKLLFYSTMAPTYLCGESTGVFNYIVDQQFGIATRHCHFYGLIEKKQRFLAHSVSEIRINGKWVMFDTLFSVMVKSGGAYLSLEETLESIGHRNVTSLRHMVPKDTDVPADIRKHDHKKYYAAKAWQHIMIDGHVSPEMRIGLDYTYLNRHYGYTAENYVSLDQLHRRYYLEANEK